MHTPMPHDLEAAREILARFLPKPQQSFELAALDIAEVIAKHRAARALHGRDADGFTPAVRSRVARGRQAGRGRKGA